MEGAFTACFVLLISFALYISFFDVKRVGQDIGIGQSMETSPTPIETTEIEEVTEATQHSE
jgi:hypothetical protein